MAQMQLMQAQTEKTKAEAATEKGLKEERSERTGLDLSTYTYCYEGPSQNTDI